MNTTKLHFEQSANPKEGSSNWGELNTWLWKGLKCRWRVSGNALHQPILLLHGFGASSCHWRNNATFFANAGFCVYGLDLIGFGESDQPGGNQVPSLNNKFWGEQVSDFLEQVVTSNSNRKTILIGNSLGSLVGLTSLTLRPDLIEALIAAPLPDPALMQPKGLLEKNKYIIILKNIFLKIFFYLLPLKIIIKLIAKTFLIKIALQAAYQCSVKSDKELLRLIVRPALRESAPRSLRAMCIGMSTRKKWITAPFLLDQLDKRVPKPPILLIWGRKDKLVPLGLGEMLIKQHPWIELSVLEETGHCPHDESSKEFNQNALNWLNRTLSSNQQKP